MIAHSFNSSTGEAEARRIAMSLGQPELHQVQHLQKLIHSYFLKNKPSHPKLHKSEISSSFFYPGCKVYTTFERVGIFESLLFVPDAAIGGSSSFG